MTARNLFPQDNRSVEIASALGLMFLALRFFLWPATDSGLLTLQSPSFWVMCCFTVGSMQLLSLLAYPHTELLRCGIGWINGLLWIWLSLSLSGPATAGIILGVLNLYAFVVNLNMLRLTWKD